MSPSEKSSSQSDLYIIGGTWDLIFWNAVALANSRPLSGDCLVFSKAFTPSQRKQIEKCAVIAGLTPVDYPDDKAILPVLKERNYRGVSTIHLSDPITHKLLKQLPNAALVIGFEGLAGYFINSKPKASIASFSYSYVHYSTLPVPDWVRAGSQTHLTPEHIRRSIKAFHTAFPDRQSTPSFGINSVLMLGQHFHRHGVLTWEQEHDLYNAFIKTQIDAGHEILWKEHPRNNRAFGHTFASAYPDRFRILDMDPLYSIELWGEELAPLKQIAGVCSNSLFNLRDIYGFNATSILTPQSLANFNFSRLSKSSLINLVGIACLNHNGMLPVQTLIAAFQKPVNDGSPSTNANANRRAGLLGRWIHRFKKLFLLNDKPQPVLP